MKLLFVDDEKKVLDGIKRALFSMGEEGWEAKFETSPRGGLALLEQEPFDVVVSDMRMPEMDGAAFLSEIHKRHPQVVRIILSGQSEEEAALRAVRVAHRFVSKPCKLESLRDMILQVFEFRHRIEREPVRALVGGLDVLAPLPQSLQKLRELLSDGEPNIKQIAVVIQQDLGFSTKVLQLANSAFFCRSSSTCDISTAVQRLGLRLLKQVLLSTLMFETIQRGNSNPNAEQIQTEAIQRLGLVSQFLHSTQAKEIGGLSAMVCDVGKLVMSARAPDLYRTVLSRMENGTPEKEAETSTFGCTHAEIGAYLLALWSVPPPVAEVTAFHHTLPTSGTPEFLEIVGAVHLASCIVEKGVPDEPWFHNSLSQDTLKQWSHLAKTLT
jgi:HD-like signal output (HDOD) protein/ActR/RegA family two-component response regulator